MIKYKCILQVNSKISKPSGHLDEKYWLKWTMTYQGLKESKGQRTQQKKQSIKRGKALANYSLTRSKHPKYMKNVRSSIATKQMTPYKTDNIFNKGFLREDMQKRLKIYGKNRVIYNESSKKCK